MKRITIREARKGLSHLETMFAGEREVLVTRYGRPVARIEAVDERPRIRSLADFRARQPRQEVPTEVLIQEERGRERS